MKSLSRGRGFGKRITSLVKRASRRGPLTLIAVLGIPGLIGATLAVLGDSAVDDLTVAGAMAAGLGTAVGGYFAATAAEKSSETAERADEALARTIEPFFRVDVLNDPAAEQWDLNPPQILRISNESDFGARDLTMWWRLDGQTTDQGPWELRSLAAHHYADWSLDRTAMRNHGWTVVDHVKLTYSDNHGLRSTGRRWWNRGIDIDPTSGRPSVTNIVSEPFET